MRSYLIRHKIACALIIIVGIFAWSVGNGGRAGGYGGGYDHGGYGNVGTFNDNGSYNRGDNTDNNDNYHSDNYYGNVDSAVVVGVPETSCSTTQSCDADGNCTESQVCN